MTQLVREKCMACHADSPHVTAEEMAQLHPQVPEWQVIHEENRKLERRFRFRDFRQALAFTNRVAEVAEAEGHHPRIVTEWGRATVTWWTHKLKDLHRNDFIMAAKTDMAYQEFLSGAGR
ncbi:MAG: 4a-hydroxytetrahydrobiopterin dehydratase [Chloroflexi bacterium]|nr:4a-hydroxytetrahydrobiopterin dehydratase [Chloroflexota bacterium]